MSQATNGNDKNRFTSSTAWLTQERLKELINYEPETGLFTRTSTGKLTGTIVKGYVIIPIAGFSFRAGRLAWFYMTGKWPIEIDHINLCKADDRWINLREATRAQNNCNKQHTTRSQTGIKGTQQLPSGRYSATIQVDKVNIYLGSFDTLEEARKVYLEAAKEHHGEFAQG